MSGSLGSYLQLSTVSTGRRLVNLYGRSLCAKIISKPLSRQVSRPDLGQVLRLVLTIFKMSQLVLGGISKMSWKRWQVCSPGEKKSDPNVSTFQNNLTLLMYRHFPAILWPSACESTFFLKISPFRTNVKLLPFNILTHFYIINVVSYINCRTSELIYTVLLNNYSFSFRGTQMYIF